MPWDSTKEGGTERLFCDVDPPIDGIAAVWLGSAEVLSETDPRIPNLDLGTQDYSLELVAWRKTTIDDDADPDEGWASGLFTENTGLLDNVGIIGIDPPSSNPAFNNIRAETAGGMGQITDLGLGDWHHFAANFVRNGNLTFYVDAVLRATTNISAGAATPLSGGIYPYTPTQISFLDTTDGLPTTGLTAALLIMREFAIHGRPLTVTEIQNGHAAMRCSQIPETLARYRAGYVLGTIEKDPTPANIKASLKVGLPAAVTNSMFALKAEDGAVQLEDLSGNGRHWGLPASLSYANVLGQRAATAFATALPEGLP